MFILINWDIKSSRHFKKFNVYLFTTLAASATLIFFCLSSIENQVCLSCVRHVYYDL